MTRKDGIESVGKGWSHLVDKFFDFVEVLDSAELTVVINSAEDTDALLPIEVEVVEVDRGMLRIVASHANSTVQEMLDKLAWVIERNSTSFCEVCGERGYRRKWLEGAPNRCRFHYIELANELADQGKI